MTEAAGLSDGQAWAFGLVCVLVALAWRAFR